MIFRLYLPIEIIRNFDLRSKPSPDPTTSFNIQYQRQHQQQLTPPRTKNHPQVWREAPIKPQVIPCNSFIMNLSQVRPSRLALCCHVMSVVVVFVSFGFVNKTSRFCRRNLSDAFKKNALTQQFWAKDVGKRSKCPSKKLVRLFPFNPCPEGKVWLEVWFGGMIRGYDSGYDSRVWFAGMDRGAENLHISTGRELGLEPKLYRPCALPTEVTWLWPRWADRVWFGYDSGMIRVWLGHNSGLWQKWQKW